MLLKKVFDKLSALLVTALLCLLSNTITTAQKSNSVKNPDLNKWQKIPKKTIHIRDFGAKGNGIFDCTQAFQKASAYLKANGGTLIIDPGTYKVGGQRFTKSYLAGSSFFEEPILFFENVEKPIEIIGYNATLKAKDGLKYGSFNPITGEKDSIRKEGNRSSYYASAYIFVYAKNCASISVKGLTMDGNAGKLDIGPAFGPEGIQLSATGISLWNNKHVDIQDCYIHHCGLDAITIAWTGLKTSDPVYPHTIKNVKARYNGRQGLSWVGGNNLTVTNCEFSSTGKALNNGRPVISQPTAGIDIEIEESIIRNGSFVNCLVYDNGGPGISSIGHDTYNINFNKVTFIGTTNSAAFPKTQGLSFDNCTFVGKVERICGSVDKSKASSFTNCLFTMEKTKSPNGKVFGDYCEFYEGQNVIFNNCEFNAATKRLPIFNQKEIVFVNCKFSQNSNEDFNGSASFKGITQFNMKGKGKLNTAESDFEGEIIYNNQRATDIKKIRME